jgi:transcriptional regulator with XRE-family HTH domain
MSESSSISTIVGRRLRELRLRLGLAQDQLGVMAGLDEGSSSARMSRYECGIHVPPLAIAEKLATILGVPMPYLYCSDEELGELILRFGEMSAEGRAQLLALARELAAQSSGAGST